MIGGKLLTIFVKLGKNDNFVTLSWCVKNEFNQLSVFIHMIESVFFQLAHFFCHYDHVKKPFLL